MAKTKRHPAERTWVGIGAIGALFLLLGGVTLFGGDLVGVVLAAMGGAFLALFTIGIRFSRAVPALNEVAGKITVGKLGEAQALLDAIKVPRFAATQRLASMHRGLIALRRGDAEVAARDLDRAATIPLGLMNRVQSKQHRAHARGLRAFARAASGDERGAREDIASVVIDDHASAEAHSFAALAQTILAERSGDREALRSALAEHGALLFEGTSARERAIVRAYQRMLKAKTASVYRTLDRSARRGDDEPELVDWVTKIAPAAAPFVTSRARSEAPRAIDELASTPAAKAAIEAARKGGKTASARTRIVAVWLLLIVMFFSIWKFLEPSRPHPSPSPSPSEPTTAAYLFLVCVVVAGLYAALIARIVRARREHRDLLRAGVLRARGDATAADEILSRVSRSRQVLTRASALLLLAREHEKKGDMAFALARCDEALKLLATRGLRAATADILFPEIVTERALVLAALGRKDESAAELATLAWPYPFVDRSRAMVRMVMHAKEGDHAAALRAIDSAGPDVTLPRRVELLADLLRAASPDARTSQLEVERIKEELRTFDAGKRWIEAVAPTALAAFTSRGASDDDDALTGDRDEAAREELAEQEAHAALEHGAPRRL